MPYKTKKRPPRPGEGRPSKYKHEYCEMLIEHLSEGLSFLSFAAQCDVDFSTLYEWEQAYPEFSKAKKRGLAKSMMFWENLGMKGMWNGGGSKEEGYAPTFNTPNWIFNMKNRFGWRDQPKESEDDREPIKLAYDPEKE